ncbi:hypothetical protein LOTGIDRAFT_158376 [Lottia gigantea]|uniref:Uncharacterized protein n=1 Tax=Lottia gigantea TaxID=225164 RepID=V4AZW8_LOTGI|nr:hypothetical protein LOTGIDRAFT_158376 [Lottia gigantea]ESO99296.1 hypothetical protein LOTGIDRAFT_158376 [Lottia gigantea]
MSRKAWNGVKKPDMLECLKTFRTNGQPPKVMANWKEAVNIETLKIEELKSGFEKMDVDPTEMAQLLGIAETRENLIVMAIATILTALESDKGDDEPPKKKAKKVNDKNPGAGIDKVSIKERIVELDSLIGSKKYVKQKDMLPTDVEKFLEEYSKSTIDKATPHDMRAFLVYKESAGDLANLRMDQIKQTEEGVLVRMTQGKTIKTKARIFCVARSANVESCPVEEILDFVESSIEDEVKELKRLFEQQKTKDAD